MDRLAPPIPVARWLRTGGEGLLISLATLSAWPFACVEPFWEYVLSVGVAVLASLWAVYSFATRQILFRLDLVSASVAVLVLWNALQLVPLPVSAVSVISPTRAEWHETFIPSQLERLPGEPSANRPTAIPLSACPHHTRTHIVRLLSLLAIHAVARNWLASSDTRLRFAWASSINGVLLALLAVGQFFSSPRGVAFWSLDVGGSLFGTFVCRNHYPDYLAFGIGGAICLLNQPKPGDTATGRWRDKLLDLFDRPSALFAALALGLMVASIPFSQSRGGVLSAAVAGVGVNLLAGWRRSRGGTTGMAVGVAAVVFVGLVLWLGVGPITERFRDESQTLDDRLPLWGTVTRQLPGLWATGAGGGTFQQLEPLGRTSQPTDVSYDHAHNEYLEAAVEGGVVRFAVTLALALGVPVLLGRQYRRRRSGFVVGVWFAVVMLVVHSAFDFSIHMPAVAVMAVAAVGLARDSGSSRGEVDHDQPARSQALLLLPATLAVVCVVCALDARTRWRADQLRQMAEATTVAAERLEFQELRTRVAPSDPASWFDLGKEQLRGRDPAGLSALRTARELGVLHPDVHFHLGLNSRRFETADPPGEYFRRACRVLPTDPDVWYARGVEELNGGNRAAAESSWRRALELSPRRLKLILQASSALSAAELRERVIPDEPEVLMRTAAERPAAERRVFVDAAARGVTRDGLTVPQLVAIGQACDETDRLEDAASMWARALAATPTDRTLRDAAARWYEQQERYDDATPHLEWLLARTPNDTGLRDRLAAARHGTDLKRVIGR